MKRREVLKLGIAAATLPLIGFSRPIEMKNGLPVVQFARYEGPVSYDVDQQWAKEVLGDKIGFTTDFVP